MTRVLGSGPLTWGGHDGQMPAFWLEAMATVMRIGRIVQRTCSGSVRSSGTLAKRAWRVNEAQNLERPRQRGLRLGRQVAHVPFPFLE